MVNAENKKILGFGGACIAFYIGAGFATMQEVMQYEASYGSRFWQVILVTAVIYIYTNISFATNGNANRIKRGGEIFSIYCGKRIGKFYDIFCAFFCYMCFVVMCGGANSTATEQWGLPNGVGAVVLTIAVIATVVMGLEGILKVLNKIGPVIIIAIIVIAAISSVKSIEAYNLGLNKIDSGSYDIAQVGNNNPIASGTSYAGFVILWFAPFISEIGSKNKIEQVNKGMVLSAFAIFGTAILCCAALISNIDVTWNVGIPALALAKMINPFFATVFAVIIFLGIYTTAVPLLWAGIKKITGFKELENKYRLVAVIMGIIGCLVSCFFPYKKLLNILYGANGYLGFALIIFMIVCDVKTLARRHLRKQ